MPTFYPYLNKITIAIKSLPPEELDTILVFACAAKADEELICVEIDGEFADPMSMSRTGYKFYRHYGGRREFVDPTLIIKLLINPIIKARG